MRHWFTRADMKLRTSTIKRFEPSHWVVDFPRGSMACAVSKLGENSLRVAASFAHATDLVGLIYESDDSRVHVGHRREANRDYSNCELRFHWRSTGILALDALNGPTLTIEGEDENGTSRQWYVRLWNYAEGSGTDADISLDFGRLDAGFLLPAEAQRVDCRRIRRMFISLAPPQSGASGEDRLDSPAIGELLISDIRCTGSGSVVDIADAFVPEHRYRICTAYDDLYNLTPERVFDEVERLGYREVINHYVGMSHYPTIGADGQVEAATPICLPARRWHESFAALAAQRGYAVIWSVSMELLDAICPSAWKQRAWDGGEALTGYDPPSTLLSPAVAKATTYLGSVAAAFVGIGTAAGLPPLVQIGEPWWWVRADGAICIYDDAARPMWSVGHEPIRDIRQVTTTMGRQVLDQAGQCLSNATASILGQVREQWNDVTTYLLAFVPSILRDDAPELRRANLPAGWSAPAFDILQLEDYDWVVDDKRERSREALASAAARLNYPPERQHYLAGFVAEGAERGRWRSILDAAERAEGTGVAEVFIWALPQVMRDGLTIFEEDDEVQSFRDVLFPLEIGHGAWVEPAFSTQISTGANGSEYRNASWEQARLRFDVGPGLRSINDLQSLLTFFRSMHGNATAFRFRDSFDCSSAIGNGEPSADDVLLGIGDGTRHRFPLVKCYGEGEVRRITRPEIGSVKVAIDGVLANDWSLGDGGVVEFASPPIAGAVVKAGYRFDVPVRFEEEKLRVSRTTYLAGEAISIPLIEVREP